MTVIRKQQQRRVRIRKRGGGRISCFVVAPIIGIYLIAIIMLLFHIQSSTVNHGSDGRMTSAVDGNTNNNKNGPQHSAFQSSVAAGPENLVTNTGQAQHEYLEYRQLQSVQQELEASRKENEQLMNRNRKLSKTNANLEQENLELFEQATYNNKKKKSSSITDDDQTEDPADNPAAEDDDSPQAIYFRKKYEAYVDQLPPEHQSIYDVATVQDFMQDDDSPGCDDVMDDTNRDYDYTVLELSLFCEWKRFVKSKDKRRQIPNVITAEKRDTKEHDITLVTQGSVDRLDRLLMHTKLWRGPISVAIYIKGFWDISHLCRFAFTNDKAVRRTTFHIFMEKVIVPEQDEYYPHNYLRNTALNYTDTEYVVNIDMDFMLNQNAYKNLRRLVLHDDSAQEALQSKTLLVLPAFELSPEGDERPELSASQNWSPADKDEMLHHVEKLQTVEPFHIRRFAGGHGATDFQKWYGNDTAAIYDINYDLGFEPYVLAKREGLPWFYPGFRGYGFNKMAWFHEVDLLFFRFAVLRDFFVFHVGDKSDDHKFSKAYLLSQKKAFDSFLKSKVKMLEERGDIPKPSQELKEQRRKEQGFWIGDW